MMMRLSRQSSLWQLAMLALPLVAAPLGLALVPGMAHAQTRTIAITDERGRDGTLVTRHTYDCGGCPIRRARAGAWRQRPPVVDYGQALPIYQPPVHTHPHHVVPVYPLRPRSGPYAVTGAPARPAMGPRQPYYPSGSEARVITLDAPRLQQPRQQRRPRS
jgi:hypothetical protein